ncbi:MAG: AI-2E family transporter [Candidatus Altiarchaeota archaeon]|nr:AI-2E family transporter [Candidatus Altiarchaeota archaeon]
MDKKGLNKFFIAAFLLILSYLSFTILRWFLISIFLGGFIAYMTYPVYGRLVRKTGSRRASALIMSTAALAVLIIFLAILTPQVIREIGRFHKLSASALPELLAELEKCSPESEDVKCKAFMYLTDNIENEALQDTALSVAKSVSDYVLKNVIDFFSNLPNLFLQATVVLFSTFYFLNNGGMIVEETLNSLPMKNAHKVRIAKRVDDVLKAVIFGNLMTAFAEGVIAAVVFYLLGMNLALIGGVLIMFFALIPPFGAAIIWVPIVAALFIMQEYAKALMILVSFALFMGFIDNIGRPMIISRKVKLSTFWVLLGVLGGILTFGFIGIIVGPLILSLFVTFLRIAGEELAEEKNEGGV